MFLHRKKHQSEYTLKKLKDILLDQNKVPLIINDTYPKEDIILATLAGDAAVMSSDKETAENLYCLQVLPLDPNYKTTAVHFHKFPKGSAPRELLTLFDDVKNKIEATKRVKVMFFATDGETTTNTWHNEKFNKWIKDNLDKDFNELIDIAKKDIPWPISDVLHLLKCARSHVLNHLICLFPENMTCINVELMEKALNLGRVLSDRTKEGRMKDSYALSLFSWESFMKLYEATRNDALYYLLPFTFMNEAVRSKCLTRQERLQFLEVAYLVLIDQYKSNAANKNPLFTEKFRKTALGTTFADTIFLKRCINTVIGMGVALKIDIDEIGLERVGTHRLECFFGYMRMCSQGNHSSDRAIRAAIKSLLIGQYSREINYKITIQKRVNEGGVKITREIDDSIFKSKRQLDIKPKEFVNQITELAKTGDSTE